MGAEPDFNSLNKKDANSHMKKAYEKMADKITNSIKDSFDLNIPVFVGSFQLKVDDIVEILEVL
ncbi:hypothetical protein MNBD_GAMMA09-3181 [hydrothermal vent metagenome]|uniref:Uncharacterized protein n=1 Tax=hydrothermal vent metagenome TaxID=652676 RepID=A0A3B0XJG5_9ZZZZ